MKSIKLIAEKRMQINEVFVGSEYKIKDSGYAPETAKILDIVGVKDERVRFKIIKGARVGQRFELPMSKFMSIKG